MPSLSPSPSLSSFIPIISHSHIRSFLFATTITNNTCYIYIILNQYLVSTCSCELQQGFQQYGAEASGPAVGAAAPVATPAAPEPASKGPLPAEHQIVQHVLNEISERCLAACQNQVGGRIIVFNLLFD